MSCYVLFKKLEVRILSIRILHGVLHKSQISFLPLAERNKIYENEVSNKIFKNKGEEFIKQLSKLQKDKLNYFYRSSNNARGGAVG